MASGVFIYRHDGSADTSADSFTYVIRSDAIRFATGRVSLTISDFTATVTSTAESGPGTLRDLVLLAGARRGNGRAVIQFDPALAGETIWLENPHPGFFGNAFWIYRQIEIDAAAAPGLTIARNPSADPMRLFYVSRTGEFTLKNVRVSGGLDEYTWEPGAWGLGAGLTISEGKAWLEIVEFSGNSVAGSDGGIFDFDGEIEALPGGSGVGAAVANLRGYLEMSSCTISDSVARAGAAGDGPEPGSAAGAIYLFEGTTHITDCTIVQNDCGESGGIFIQSFGDPAILYLRNSTLSNLLSPTDFLADDEAGPISILTAGNQIRHQSKPWIGPIPDQNASIPFTIPFNLGPRDATGPFTVEAEASVSPELIQSIGISGTGTALTLNLVPSESAQGKAAVTVTLREGNISMASEFQVEVGPSIAAIADSFETDERTPITLNVLANDFGLGRKIASIDASSVVGILQLINGGSALRFDPAGQFQFLRHGETILQQFTCTITNLSGEMASAQVSLTIHGSNDPPVTIPLSVERQRNRSVKILATKLLLNAADPEGDSLTLLSVASFSPAGAEIALDSGWVLYMPPRDFNVPDSFTYVVADPDGGTATGTVLVTVDESDAVTLNLVREEEAGQMRIRFFGIPGRTYLIQASSTLVDPVWETLGEATAGPTGAYQFVDIPDENVTQRYYRSIQK